MSASPNRHAKFATPRIVVGDIQHFFSPPLLAPVGIGDVLVVMWPVIPCPLVQGDQQSIADSLVAAVDLRCCHRGSHAQIHAMFGEHLSVARIRNSRLRDNRAGSVGGNPPHLSADRL